MSTGPRAGLLALRDALRSRFIERDALVDSALAALVCGHHLLIVGPPGTAKSQLAEALTGAIEGAVGFRWLLTRFTTPEELFGPISLKGLEQDRYARVTAGKLPQAHVVFLDEVFKASSAILNALLTVLNERRFHNGDQVESIPLMTLIGAANTLPDEDELLALYDRFLVRITVDYIKEDFRFLKLLVHADDPPLPTVTLDAVEAARAEAAALPIDPQVLRDLTELRTTLRKVGVVVSDRRWRQSLAFLRAHAWLAGNDQVVSGHLFVLEHVLWSAIEERDEVIGALTNLLAGARDEVRKLLFQARAIAEYPTRFPNDPEARDRAALEAYTKINQLLSEARGQVLAARRQGRGDPTLDEALTEMEGLQAMVSSHLGTPLQ